MDASENANKCKATEGWAIEADETCGKRPGPAERRGSIYSGQSEDDVESMGQCGSHRRHVVEYLQVRQATETRW